MYKLDKHKPEPFPLLAWLFVLGILSSIPAGILNTINIGLFSTAGEWMVGFVEEGIKFLAVYIGVRKTSHFDEPIDGVIYAATVALGFSFVENILYLFEPYRLGSEITSWTLIRGSTSFLHVLLSSIWGVGYALYKLKIISKSKVFGLLILSAFIHSSYNAFVNEYTMVLVLLLGAVYFHYKIYQLNRMSPDNLMDDIHCPHCNSGTSGNSLFCNSCGKTILKRKVSFVKQLCQDCSEPVEKKWKFCKACGTDIK